MWSGTCRPRMSQKQLTRPLRMATLHNSQPLSVTAHRSPLQPARLRYSRPATLRYCRPLSVTAGPSPLQPAGRSPLQPAALLYSRPISVTASWPLSVTAGHCPLQPPLLRYSWPLSVTAGGGGQCRRRRIRCSHPSGPAPRRLSMAIRGATTAAVGSARTDATRCCPWPCNAWIGFTGQTNQNIRPPTRGQSGGGSCVLCALEISIWGLVI